MTTPTNPILCRVQVPGKNAKHCFRVRHEALEESIKSTWDNKVWEDSPFPFVVYRGSKRINAFVTFKAAMACVVGLLD